MNILVMAPESAAAQMHDVDYARCLVQYSGQSVYHFDVEELYGRLGRSAFEVHVQTIVREKNIGLLLYWLGTDYDFSPQFLEATFRAVYSVLIVGDDEHYFDVSNRYYGQCFDLVLTNNPILDRYRLYDIQAQFLPNVFDSRIFKPAEEPRKDIDVSFIGRMPGKLGRSTFVDALRTAGINVETYGMGTARGIVTREQMIDIYQRSRINLNFTGVSEATPLDAHLSINRRIRQVKGRSTKVALCGSFFLSQYAPGLERIFDIGREIDVFEDENQLVQKVRLYLQNVELREAMARRARERALRNYDEGTFWSSLTADLIARAQAKSHGLVRQRTLCIDQEFWVGFAASRFKYIAIFFFSGQLHALWQELKSLISVPRPRLRTAAWFYWAGLHVAAKSSKAAASIIAVVNRLRRRS